MTQEDRIRRLEKLMEMVVADIDILNEALDAISDGVDNEATEIGNLREQLQTLQNSTPASVDLSGVIAKAQGIEQRLQTISAVASDPANADTTTIQTDTSGSSGTGDQTGTSGSGDGSIIGAGTDQSGGGGDQTSSSTTTADQTTT